MRETCEMLSMFGTVVLVAICLRVISQYAPTVIAKIRSKDSLEFYDYLILGIVVSFVAAICDNVYWSIPWTLDFVKSELAASWFFNGVYSNVVFRQLFGIVAGLLHLVPVLMKGRDERKKLTTYLAWSVLVGLAYVCSMIAIRG